MNTNDVILLVVGQIQGESTGSTRDMDPQHNKHNISTSTLNLPDNKSDMYNSNQQLTNQTIDNPTDGPTNDPTVAQKTVQMFACFGKIELVQKADIIYGPDFLITKNTTY